jgi:hypothetical protein
MEGSPGEASTLLGTGCFKLREGLVIVVTLPRLGQWPWIMELPLDHLPHPCIQKGRLKTTARRCHRLRNVHRLGDPNQGDVSKPWAGGVPTAHEPWATTSCARTQWHWKPPKQIGEIAPPSLDRPPATTPYFMTKNKRWASKPNPGQNTKELMQERAARLQRLSSAGVGIMQLIPRSTMAL